MSLLSLCRKTMTIERAAQSVGTVGGVLKSFAPVYSDIPCTIQPKRGGLKGEFGKMSQNITHTIYTPTVIVLQTGDRAVIEGNKYVIHAWGDQADRGEVFAIYAERKD